MTSQFKISYHSAPDADIARIVIHSDVVKNTSPPKMIVLQDISGSMGSNVRRIVAYELPLLFETLGYSPDDEFILITFESISEVHKMKVSQFRESNLSARGGTNMAPAIDLLKQELDQLAGQSVRILLLTDGDVFDQVSVMQKTQELKKLLGDSCEINAQAVRTFTSAAQPDTRACTGIMQLNNANSSTLVDFNMQIPQGNLANVIAPLFLDDGLSSGSVRLESSTPVLMTQPWKPATTILNLVPGENLFWIKSVENVEFRIDGQLVNLERSSEVLNAELIQTLLSKKITQSMNLLAVLKVVGTMESLDEAKSILDYWTRLDQSIIRQEFDMNAVLASNTSLAARIAAFGELRRRSERSFVTRMSELANIDRVNLVNSAQSANFLRSVNNPTSLSRGMARRMIGSGLDFTSNLQREFVQLGKHISELADLDDSKHMASFYSQETTLGALREIAKLSEDDIALFVDEDFLKMANIIGVACSGPIGDFPDPMCYRIDEIYTGCPVSLSDVLTVKSMGKDNDLKVPGQQGSVITNVIPVFEDECIHLYYRRYAPKLLEYLASVGMRRIIGEISMTYGYTLAAGLVKLTQLLSKSSGRTESNILAFVNITRDFRTAAGKYFDHIIPKLGYCADGKTSYWLAKNGATNMIVPFIDLIKSGNDTHKFPDILRAIYTFETWQVVRKSYRKDPDAVARADALTSKLIGFDIEAIKAPLLPLFEPENLEPSFCTDYHMNETEFQYHSNRCWFIDFLIMLPELIRASSKSSLNESIVAVRELPDMDDTFLASCLGIDYDLKTFKFYNIVQALIVKTSEDRFDENSVKPVLVDLVNDSVGQQMCREIVHRYVKARFDMDVSQKTRLETQILNEELVEQICEAADDDTRFQLLKVGIHRGNSHAQIVSFSSLGYVLLRKKILENAATIPNVNQLIKILLLAKDNNQAIWNGGNVLLQTASQLEELHQAWQGSQEDWKILSDYYLKNRRQEYRLSKEFNRHGHGNSKPSFFGMGYTSMEEMIDSANLAAWEDYKTKHVRCCGMQYLSGVWDARIRTRLDHSL
jgi:hypothetical protein